MREWLPAWLAMCRARGLNAMPCEEPGQPAGPVCSPGTGSAADCWLSRRGQLAMRKNFARAVWANPLSAVDLRRQAAAGPEPQLASCGTQAPPPALAQQNLGDTKRGDATGVTSVNERFG